MKVAKTSGKNYITKITLLYLSFSSVLIVNLSPQNQFNYFIFIYYHCCYYFIFFLFLKHHDYQTVT